MRNFMKLATIVVAAVICCVGWAGFAQVQDKAKDKPATAAKKSNDGAKPAADAPRQPAAPVKTAPSGAKDAKKPAAADKPNADSERDDETAIRNGAEVFVAAYNAHDAKAVSELFALKAEFTDEDGSLIRGREAIERDFAARFAEFPECQIELEIDSIRLLTPNIAIEEGIVRGQPLPTEPKNVSSYVAVHVKVEGRFLIASVKDFKADPYSLSASDVLQELAWMVGDWIDESPDAIVKSSCRWDDSGNYLLHDFVLQIPGGKIANGSMRIGWDPLTGQIKSWTFNSDSGYSEGIWTRIGDEWSVKSRGVNGQGDITFATYVYRSINHDTMTWRAYDRVVGGEPAEDVLEYIIKRQAPPPQE